jgi:hypothetical protein
MTMRRTGAELRFEETADRQRLRFIEREAHVQRMSFDSCRSSRGPTKTACPSTVVSHKPLAAGTNASNRSAVAIVTALVEYQDVWRPLPG